MRGVHENGGSPRTQGSAKGINATVTTIAKEMARKKAELDGRTDITTEDIEGLEVGYARAQDLSLRIAAMAWPLFCDVDVKFIVTDRSLGFLIGDHPVAFNNQYVEHHPDLKHLLAITGLAAKGIQAFLPLSPSVTLALFDPVVYQYGGSSRICRAGPADVELLNHMQVAHAFNALYFDPARTPEAAMNRLWAARQQRGRSTYSRDLTPVDMNQAAEGMVSHTFAISGEVRLGGKLSFVKSKDHHRYFGYPYSYAPVRSQALLDEVRKAQASAKTKNDEHPQKATGVMPPKSETQR